MRIVLDTNVVISALLWRGPRYRLLDAIRQRSRLQLYSSPILLEELAEVLTRPWATKQLNAIGKAARDVLPDYILAIGLIEPAELPRVVRDPDDDHVLACALTARADLIVTGDGDLLALHAYQDMAQALALAALSTSRENVHDLDNPLPRRFPQRGLLA